MACVILERSYERPITQEEWIEVDRKLDPCLEARNARWIRSFLSRDRDRSLCEFEVPDADTVRISCREARVAFDRVWRTEIISPQEMGTLTSKEPLIVVERSCDPPVTEDSLKASFQEAESCFQEYGVEWICSLVPPDGRWSVCLFTGTDADTVRSIFRRFGKPFQRAWVAQLLTP